MIQNSIGADPGFIDGANGDFTLSPSSPALDRGKVLQLFDWTSTYQGSAPDAGAFEGDQPFIGPKFGC